MAVAAATPMPQESVDGGGDRASRLPRLSGKIPSFVLTTPLIDKSEAAANHIQVNEP
jgi:hypothetical protein